ncbi:Uncharacterised protein [Veillonella atypica]|uniref:Uncharacterized protein n=1 Tax=Veillonella atypica TaxID=39777 RepID=A0A6N2ZNS7_9FIRM
MLNINQVFLSGNVVADAELRYTKQVSQYLHLEWQQINT